MLEMFLTGQRAFGNRVRAISDAQWSAPTPNAQWSVADLVRHLVDEHRWLPPLMHGLDLASAGDVVAGARNLPVGGGVGSNLAESWDEAAVGAADAALEPHALQREVELSRGSAPARDYLLEMTVDLAVHSWDLSVAIGFVESLPGDLVAFVEAAVSGWGDLSASGYFGPAVPVADDAPAIDKLVGATGRDPNWSGD